ncbi:alpha/beta hydrolase family protein [Brevundimonas sp. NPDC092305]|uniref:alpha/beta hydrolase family protein n=1 Tax=Brevundimonas sp. NPDC092305 TaxID=3363957 RepID=UPI003807BA83
MRLSILLAGLVLATAPATHSLAQVQPAPAAHADHVQHITLPTADGRSVDLSIWPAAEEKGVVVFSHGFNGAPAAYDRILSAWAAHGFTIVAPLHVDSLRHPEHDRYDNRDAFRTRLIDLGVARGFVKVAHAGKPIIAAGHSFGSLMSLIEGGALTAAGPLGDPDVRGVIAFSTAGDLPGVVTPDTYGALNTPLLLITGDQDLVPGYVTDWTQHRTPFDRSATGDKTLMIFAGADHELVGRADEAQFSALTEATEAFLDAYALGDATAKDRLQALNATGVTIERR